MKILNAYIPMDRRWALARGEALPDRTNGAVLFADISGSTPLTAALTQELGSRRGAEEITRYLNRVYSALIAEVHAYSGSIIGFSGDAITCWFDGDNGRRASACAIAVQKTMAQFKHLQTPGGTNISMEIKVAVTAGPARRFLVGQPSVHTIEVMAGTTLDRMAAAEHEVGSGEIVLGEEVVEALGDGPNEFGVIVETWRTTVDGQRLALVKELR